MFTKSASIYDLVYSFKNYAADAEYVRKLIECNKKSAGNRLLDVACGTGKHLSFLSKQYDVEGLDLDPDLLSVASKNNPGVLFHHMDMVNFRIGKEYDVIISLFSAIGYLKSTGELSQCLNSMSLHLKPGGVLIIEPWLTPDLYKDGLINARFVDEADIKIARMNIMKKEGNKSKVNFHYLVATKDGVEYFTEPHELTLFTHAEYMNAFATTGLTVTFDPKGLMDRGLYIAVK